MERRCALRQRARTSFEKVHGGEAPPRLQVIGFNVCTVPSKSAAEAAEAKRLELASGALRNEASDVFFSPPAAPQAEPASSSPRSALQQLLVTPSLSCASPPAPLHSLPHATSPLVTDQQVINEYSRKPSRASITKEKYADSHDGTGYTDKKTSITKEKYADFHDGTGYTDKKTCMERPDTIKETVKTSSSLHLDREEASTGSSDGQNGVLQVSQRSLGNEKSRKSSWTDQEGTSKKNSLFMFAVSSTVPEVHRHHHHGEYNVCKDAYFLSFCHLCRRHLGHGKDVFMYSGDKAFCSMECRYQQIAIDERKERCPPPIIRSGAPQVYQHASISASSPPTASHHPVVSIGKPHFINTAAAA